MFSLAATWTTTLLLLCHDLAKETERHLLDEDGTELHNLFCAGTVLCRMALAFKMRRVAEVDIMVNIS